MCTIPFGVRENTQLELNFTDDPCLFICLSKSSLFRRFSYHRKRRRWTRGLSQRKEAWTNLVPLFLQEESICLGCHYWRLATHDSDPQREQHLKKKWWYLDYTHDSCRKKSSYSKIQWKMEKRRFFIEFRKSQRYTINIFRILKIDWDELRKEIAKKL